MLPAGEAALFPAIAGHGEESGRSCRAGYKPGYKSRLVLVIISLGAGFIVKNCGLSFLPVILAAIVLVYRAKAGFIICLYWLLPAVRRIRLVSEFALNYGGHVKHPAANSSAFVQALLCIAAQSSGAPFGYFPPARLISGTQVAFLSARLCGKAGLRCALAGLSRLRAKSWQKFILAIG